MCAGSGTRGVIAAGRRKKGAGSRDVEAIDQPGDAKSPASTSDAAQHERWRAHRARQRSIRKNIDQLLGELEKSPPLSWGERAYLMLVATLYEFFSRSDLSLDELATLSRILAENRRADAQCAKLPGHVGVTIGARDEGKPFGAAFRKALRAAYGLYADEEDDAEPQPARAVPARAGGADEITSPG